MVLRGLLYFYSKPFIYRINYFQLKLLNIPFRSYLQGFMFIICFSNNFNTLVNPRQQEDKFKIHVVKCLLLITYFGFVNGLRWVINNPGEFSGITKPFDGLHNAFSLPYMEYLLSEDLPYALYNLYMNTCPWKQKRNIQPNNKNYTMKHIVKI